jgi:Domain of unknown function (DUF4112)
MNFNRGALSTKTSGILSLMTHDRTLSAPVSPRQESSLPRARPDPRLRRLRWVAWLLDRSIPLGHGWSIGVDPLIGLVPGVGDFITTAASFYIVCEAGRLGLPAGILLRMLGNIAADTLLGAIPVLGDLFDFAWQSNVRNLRLIEAHYSPELRERPVGRLVFALMLSAAILIGLLGVGGFFVVRGMIALFS